MHMTGVHFVAPKQEKTEKRYVHDSNLSAGKKLAKSDVYCAGHG